MGRRKKLIVGILSLALIASIALIVSIPQTRFYVKLMFKAREYVRYKEKERFARELIRRNPKDARGYGHLALVHMGLGFLYERIGGYVHARREYDRSIPLWEQVIKLDRGDSKFLPYDQLCIVWEGKGDIDMCIKYAKKNAELLAEEFSGEGYRYLAELYKKKGIIEEAFQAAKESVRLSPELPDHHYLLGTIYEEKHMLEKAILEYREAMMLQLSKLAHSQKEGMSTKMRERAKEDCSEYWDAFVRCSKELVKRENSIGRPPQRGGATK